MTAAYHRHAMGEGMGEGMMRIDGVECHILGPVGIKVHGGPVKLTRRRERQVLGLLLLDVGRPLSTGRLIELLWSGEPPASAPAVLQTAVSRLRAALARVEGVDVVRRGDGYAVETDPETVDAYRFRRLVDEAGRAGDARVRGELARQALALWRGPVLADADVDSTSIPACAELDETRRRAFDLRVQADLELGRHEAVIGELTGQVAADPLNERVVVHLAVALYRSGRRADALATCQQARARLVEQLGLDPGDQLQQLEVRILRADPTLDLMAPAAPPTDYRAQSTARIDPAPAQLPLDVHGLTGRVAEIGRLDGLLAEANDGSSAVVICVLSGMAGAGKTTLAVHWAHLVRDHFPDGQLFVNLRGFDPSAPAADPAQIVQGFLVAFGVPAQRIPPGLDVQIGLYRSILAGRRVLVVLDNARDAAQVRPLLPSSPGCFALITSRGQMPGLLAAEAAKTVVLDPLPAADARRLLARRLGPDRVDAEPDAVDDVVRRCAGLPLALSIAAAHAASRPALSLATLAARLRQARGLLNVDAAADPTMDPRVVFASSYRVLSSPAAALFRLLGLHPGPDTSIPAAASLAGIPADRTAAVLAELTAAHLVSEPTTGRYTMHDLLRVYAAELTHTIDSDERKHAATRRMLDHYLHTAHAAALLLHRHRDQLTLDPPAPNVRTDTLADLPHARAWFTTEHRVLLGAVGQAAETGFETHAWQLAWTLTNYLDRHGHWHDWTNANTVALAAAQRLRDRSGQAHAHHGLGLVHIRLGAHHTAHTHLRQALVLHQQMRDDIGQAHTHLNLALACQHQDRLTDALQHARRALELFRKADHKAGQGNALNTVGWYHALLGNHRLALTYCEQALAIQKQINDRHEQAFTWDSIGYAHHHLGHHNQAITSYQHAIDLWRHLGDRYYEADTIARRGETHQAVGDPDAARTDWRHALNILDDLGHPDANDVRAKLATANAINIHHATPK